MATTTTTLAAGARTSLTTSALNSLASATYVNAGTITASGALDVIVEVEATPGTVATPKQLTVFIQESLDNSNFSTGPVSGTTTTDEPVLYFLGVVPMLTNSTLQRKAFSVVAALGFIPPYFKVICKNETGAALASSGHAVSYSLITGSST